MHRTAPHMKDGGSRVQPRSRLAVPHRTPAGRADPGGGGAGAGGGGAQRAAGRGARWRLRAAPCTVFHPCLQLGRQHLHLRCCCRPAGPLAPPCFVRSRASLTGLSSCPVAGLQADRERRAKKKEKQKRKKEAERARREAEEAERARQVGRHTRLSAPLAAGARPCVQLELTRRATRGADPALGQLAADAG